MLPPLVGGGIKRRCCLTSVCAYIRPKSRTDPWKTKIGTEVAHVTRDTSLKVKKSKVKVTRPLYSPPCWRVGTCWPWETAATLPFARRRKALRRPRGRRGVGHIVAAARLLVIGENLIRIF